MSGSRSTNSKHLSSWVHSSMLAMWWYSVEPTPEEDAWYDRHLRAQLRPPPVYSPHLPKPHVNWNRLNPGQLKNLPKPSPLPVQGCSPLQACYEETKTVQDGYGYYRQILKWNGNGIPFGQLYGFHTNMGVVGVPDVPVHGYRCCSGSGVWEIDARG